MTEPISAKKTTSTIEPAINSAIATKPTFKQALVVALLLVVLDQITKAWIVGRFAMGEGEAITSFLNLVRAHNPGAAFSFLANAGGWQRWFFTALSVVAVGAIIYMLRQPSVSRLHRWALTLILAGALGNLIDRVRWGYVVDFLDFHWDWLSFLFYGGHFPAFNVADSAITVGAICLIWDEVRRWGRR